MPKFPGATLPDLLGQTAYTTRNAAATDVDGTNWKDLLDMSVLDYPEEIWGFTLTIAGGWAGLCQFRIVNRYGAKIFPFGAQYVENTNFFSGIPVNFPSPVVAILSYGYKVQFRSTNGADGAGQTCALTELPVIQRYVFAP